MNRSALLLSLGSLMLLAACDHQEGLTARGQILVTDGADLATGFPFEQDTRLDQDEASAEARIIGSCEMRRTLDEDGARQWSVLATIEGAPQEGLGLSSITMSSMTGGLGTSRIDALLGQTPYESGEDCVLDVPYALGDDDGMVALQGDCMIADADGNSALASIDIEFVGCTVADGED